MWYFIPPEPTKLVELSDENPPVEGDVVEIMFRARVVGVGPREGIEVQTRPDGPIQYVNWRGQETFSICAYRKA